jgi:hypothetical protein
VVEQPKERRLVARVERFWNDCRGNAPAWPRPETVLERMSTDLDPADRARSVCLGPGTGLSVTVVPGVVWTAAHLGEDLAFGAGLTGADAAAIPRLDSLLGLLLSKLPDLYRRGEPVRLAGADQIEGRLVVLRAVALPLGSPEHPETPVGCLGAANMKVQE